MAITFEVVYAKGVEEIDGVEYHIVVNEVFRGNSRLIQFRILLSRTVEEAEDRRFSIQQRISSTAYKNHRVNIIKKMASQYEDYLQKVLGEDYSPEIKKEEEAKVGRAEQGKEERDEMEKRRK